MRNSWMALEELLTMDIAPSIYNGKVCEAYKYELQMAAFH